MRPHPTPSGHRRVTGLTSRRGRRERGAALDVSGSAGRRPALCPAPTSARHGQGNGTAAGLRGPACLRALHTAHRKITAFNEGLAEDPELVNTEPCGGGWLFRIEVSNRAEDDELLTAEGIPGAPRGAGGITENTRTSRHRHGASAGRPESALDCGRRSMRWQVCRSGCALESLGDGAVAGVGDAFLRRGEIQRAADHFDVGGALGQSARQGPPCPGCLSEPGTTQASRLTSSAPARFVTRVTNRRYQDRRG